MAVIPLQVAQRSLDTGNVVSYPQGSPIGAAIESGGDQLQAVAEHWKAVKDQQDKFDTGVVDDELKQRIAAAEDAAARDPNLPADGSGLHDNMYGAVDPRSGRVIKPGTFDKIFEEQAQKVPESQRANFYKTKEPTRLAGSNRFATVQYTTRQSYEQVELAKSQDNILNGILQGDPNDMKTFLAFKQQGLARIESTTAPALDKEKAKYNWNANATKALFQAWLEKDPKAAGMARAALGFAGPVQVGGGGNPNLPAGMRNNNPGNMKFVSNSRFGGVVGPSKNTDQGDPQMVFATPQDGMRAAYQLAVRKYQGGKTTANQLIAGDGGWTPGNTQAAANIAATMGIGPNDDLNLQNPASAAKFLRGLVTQEHGPASQAYPDAMLADAVAGRAGPADGATAASAPRPRSPGVDLPIVFGNTAGRVSSVPDMKGVKPEVISKFRSLQNVFGTSLPIVSGYRDPARNERAGGAKASQHLEGNAFDIDVSAMPREDRVRLIQTARAEGWGGIGVYGNSIHIDTGPVRAWGASHHSDSLPGWARSALADAPADGEPPAAYVHSAPDPRFAGLSPDDRLTLLNQADAQYRQQQASDIATAKADYTAYKDRFKLGVADGTIKEPGMILADTRLDDGDKAELYSSLQSKNKENMGVDALMSAIGAGQKVDINPFNPDVSKIADKAYNQFISAVPPDKRDQASTGFVESTGYIPDTLQANLRQGAASKDAGELAASLSRADAVERIAPTAFTTIPGNDVQTKLTDYRHLVNELGMSGKDAAQELIRRADPAVKVNREVLKPDAEKFQKTLTIGDVTDAYDPGIFGSEPGAGIMPEQSSALLAEYREIATDAFYETNGDVGLAKSRALAELKTRWNITNISGAPNLMRLPPEKQYPPIGGNFDYLRADALATASAYAEPLGHKVENVTVLPSAQTRADIELKRPPRYRLFYQYTEHGQTKFDEVLSGPWAVDAATMQKVSDETATKFKHDLAIDDQANDIERAAVAKAKVINEDPNTQDFIRALNSEATIGAGRMQADMYRSEQKKLEEPPAPPQQPRPQQPRGGGSPDAGAAFRRKPTGNN